MLFHTWVFLLFFAAFYPVYLALRTSRWRNTWLLASSYVFYAWWNPLYLGLIVYSTLLDYVCVQRMEGGGRKPLWLAISLVNNLGLLGFFKYGGFVTESLNAALAALGIDRALPAPDVLLPVGISFYTFQSMSYTIDYVRGQVPAERSFVRFATFVSLFPQLVAGPIERARTLLPQLSRAPQITVTDVADGASLFVIGLFKKVALADYLAVWVDEVYAVPGRFGAADLALATALFGWQIYFDFSGYTDMARGLARAMGLRLMLNFRRPYLADGLGDFWRRWHISLSTWFRDYVYIPLGGNRGTMARLVTSVFLTMVVSGLWHGAAWTFVIWGAFHGLGAVLTRPLERSEFYRERVPLVVKRVGVFAFVCVGWVLFRAETFADAQLVLLRMAALEPGPVTCPWLALALVATVWLVQWGQEVPRSLWWRLTAPAPVRVALAAALLLWLAIVPKGDEAAFIYFQF